MQLTHHHTQRGTRLGALLTLLVTLLASFGGGQLALAQTQPFVIQDIRVEGLQRISPGSVFAALPVGVGDTVDTFGVRAAAKSLFASGNFDDISIARDGGVLVVVVAERPSISEITIDGNKAIETEALLDGLKGAASQWVRSSSVLRLRGCNSSCSANMCCRADTTPPLTPRSSLSPATVCRSRSM